MIGQGNRNKNNVPTNIIVFAKRWN